MPEAEFNEAIENAAQLLARAGAPVIAGLGADIAGIVAAFRLAERLGAAIDHDYAPSVLREQRVLSDIGLMFVSPGEVARADTLLMVGDGAMLPETSGDTGAARTAGKPRFVKISSGSQPMANEGHILLDTRDHSTGVWLAMLRARLGGRPFAETFDATEADRCAALLKGAKFGVAVWSPAELDPLAIEMLVGLVKDLNEETRWSGLSVPESGSAAGAALAAGWMTGVPLRAGFGRGYWEHDPWRFDARRLIGSGEADAVLYICSYGDPPPDWVRDTPLVALTNDGVPNPPDAVSIRIGQPGRDHDAIGYDRRTGTLGNVSAERPTAIPTVADALNAIAGRLAAS